MAQSRGTSQDSSLIQRRSLGSGNLIGEFVTDRKSRNWISRLATFFLPFFLLVMTPTVGIWLSVVREGQVANLIKSTLSDDTARESVSLELAKALTTSMDKGAQVEAKAHKDELASAISARLAEVKVQEKFASVADQVFTSITTGAATVSIDPEPLLDELVIAVNSVQGIEKISKKDLGEIKPIKLGSKRQPLPDLSSIIKSFELVGLLTLIFAGLCLFAILRFSETPFRGAAIPLLIQGAMWSIGYFLGIDFAMGKLQPGIQSDLIPVVAGEVLAGIRFIGFLLLLLGIASLATHVINRRKFRAQSFATE